MEIVHDFDSAALRRARIDGDRVVLTPRPHPFNGRPTGCWSFFRVDGGRGRTLHFHFDTSDCVLHGHQAANRYLVSDDGERWRVVDRTSGEDDCYSFTQQLGADRVWFAQMLPYPVARVAAQVARWLASPLVRPSASADARGRLGAGPEVWLTPGGRNEEGYAIPPQPLYALAIAEAETAAEQRPTVIVLGGNHPGEHYASHALEAFVDWLIGDSAPAAALRRQARTLIYPMVNPDGRHGGYVRGNQLIPAGDHNRLWGAMDRGAMPAIDRIKDAIAADSAGPVAFFLDVHGQELPDRHYLFADSDAIEDPQQGGLLPFLATMQEQLDRCDIREGLFNRIAAGDTTARTWARSGDDGPRAAYAYTMEVGNIPDGQPETSFAYGRAMGRALAAGLQAFT